MKLNIGDDVVTIKRLVYGTTSALRELPKGVVGEVVGSNSHWYQVVFDYPGFRDCYVYVRLERDILPIEQNEAPEVDAKVLESILQNV